VERLPHAVEAIFVLPGSTPADRDKARAVQAAFTAEFGLSEQDMPPIVLYDSASRTSPFRRIDLTASAVRDDVGGAQLGDSSSGEVDAASTALTSTWAPASTEDVEQ
jgi:hypothetical protein